METLYICGEADISRDESTILIKTQGAKKRIPIEAIRHIVVMSDGTLTTKFLALSDAPGSASRSSIITAGLPVHLSQSRIPVPAKSKSAKPD